MCSLSTHTWTCRGHIRTLNVILCGCSCYPRGLLLNFDLTILARLANQWVQESCGPHYWGYRPHGCRHMQPCLTFFMNAGDSNPGSHVCRASVVTGPSPQPRFNFSQVDDYNLVIQLFRSFSCLYCSKKCSSNSHVIKSFHPPLNILNKFWKLELIFKNWYDCQAVSRRRC